MQNTSGCCHNIHTTNAPVQIFCPLFLVEVTNQYNCTVIRRCPHSKTLHQLSRPACNLKVRITPQICLYRVNDHQLWTKLYNRLSDTFIIKRQATIHFFIYKSHIPTICATCFQVPPFDNSAIRFIIMVDFPSPGSPCSNVIFPTAMNGYHNQRTAVASTSLYNVKIPVSSLPVIPFAFHLQSFSTFIL